MKTNKTYNVVIANEACNFTDTKYNTTLTGHKSFEAASDAAREALRNIAGGLGFDRYKIVFNSPLYVSMLINRQTQAVVVTAMVVEVETAEATTNTPATMNEANKSKKMYTDYKTAVNWLNNSLILCNNIVEVDPSVFDNARFEWYNEETGQETEVYQWYLTDCSDDDVQYLESRFPGLLFAYSDVLDMYVLCVDHYGTCWSGVSIETTLENAAKENI